MEKGILERSILTFHNEGLGAVLRKLRNRLSKPLMHRHLLVLELPFTGELPVIEPKIPVTFEELGESDFGELIALRPYLTEEVIRLRLGVGHRVYVGKLDGKIVYTLLVAIDKAYIGYLGLAFPLSPYEVYFGEAYTIPEYRGNHLHPVCMSFMSRTMRQLGYRHAVEFVYPHNQPALRSGYKVGFERKGYLGFVEGFGIRRYFYLVRGGGFDCLQNAFFVPRDRLVPAELEGQIW